MTIEISFSLDDQDVAYFRDVMHKAQAVAEKASEQEIIQKARSVLEGAKNAKAPLFVRDRLEQLSSLIGMLEDPEWPLDGQERLDVVSALAYFHNPQDLIADDVPVIGLIDDAIMIELVARELTHQLEAYSDFCVYRDSEDRMRDENVTREAWLQAKQKELMLRMRERLGRINRGARGSTRLTRFSFLN